MAHTLPGLLMWHERPELTGMSVWALASHCFHEALKPDGVNAKTGDEQQWHFHAPLALELTATTDKLRELIECAELRECFSMWPSAPF